MALPQLNLRDLFWLVLVVALGLGWWIDRESTRGYVHRAGRFAAEAAMQAQAAEVLLLQERERRQQLLAELQERGIDIDLD